jgi:hypothetical protein
MNSSIKLGRVCFEKKIVSNFDSFSQNTDQPQSNELIRRSGGSTATLHHHCPPDSTSKVRTVKRDMTEKIARKDYEIKTLKQVCFEIKNNDQYSFSL